MTSKPVPSFMKSFQQDAEKAQADLAGAGRFTPIYFRIGTRKTNRGNVGIVEVVNPEVRDEHNKPEVKQFDELQVVLLNHTMTREMQYTGPDGKIKTECVSVGPKRSGVGVGTLHNGAMSCFECAAAFPEGWDRPHIPYGSETVTTGKVKCNSRYQVTVLLPKEAWVNDEPTLAMGFLSMTSAYGVTIKDAADAAERSKTLLAYPEKNDPEGHKGILHTLLTRPWETGESFGIETKGTPHNAIFLTVTGEWLGDVPVPVPAFTLGDELDAEWLEIVEGLRPAAAETAQNMIEQRVKDAYPALAEKQRNRLGSAALDGRWDDFSSTARTALPQLMDAPEQHEAEDADFTPVAETPKVEVEAARQAQIDEEFPPEIDMPF